MPVDFENTTFAKKKEVYDIYRRRAKSITYFRIIKEPAITKALPVAQDGIDAKIGEKKTEIKNMRPMTMPVIPVRPPSVAISEST